MCMRRALSGLGKPAAAVGLRALSTGLPTYSTSCQTIFPLGMAAIRTSDFTALSHQRCFYSSTTRPSQSWFSGLFDNSDKTKKETATDKNAEPAKDAPAVTQTDDGEPKVSIPILLKRLAEDKETPLSFLVKLMKSIMGSLREKQTMEMQSVVEETSSILTAMRKKLQALVDKVAAAEALLHNKFPTKAEQKKIEEGNEEDSSEPKK